MASWWHNLIKLWEMPDASALDAQKKRPGTVLKRGMRGEAAMQHAVTAFGLVTLDTSEVV